MTFFASVNTASGPTRLSKVVVTDLFDLYTHSVSLKLDDRITIIHGPNGVGKTVLLTLIASTLGGRYFELIKFTFRSLELYFTDGSNLHILRGRTSESDESFLTFTLTRASGEANVFNFDPKSTSTLTLRINSVVPWVTRQSNDEWYDSDVGDILSSSELLTRYSDYVPESTLRTSISEPEWLQKFRSQIPVHFIATQRLLEINRRADKIYRHNQAQPVTFAVKSISDDLLERISYTFAQYATNSQRLDQTFPNRLLGQSFDRYDVAELKKRMTHIDARRSELIQIGLLEEAPAGYPLESVTLEAVNEQDRAVMTLYVQDSNNKLSALDDLARRAKLLLGIVNSKFSHKQLRISRQAGLSVSDNANRALQLSDLSSGEQHQLVLTYNLLFRVQKNALVLIDEPELSLHVDWQDGFLNDLLDIVGTNLFDVILATHSPYIVGSHDELMIALESDTPLS